MAFLAASSLDEALSAIDGEPGQAIGERPRVLAGGTDFFPSLGDRPAPPAVLDVSKIPELRGVTRTAQGWRIGAATSWTALVKTPLPRAFDGLKSAARDVGSVQIQNAGTIAGNLCNASPAADGVPPLLTLNADVELRSRSAARRLALGDFLQGVRRTALRPDELMVAIHVPATPETARSAFLKLGARRYLVISICMVAAVLTPDESGRVAEARIAVGACSPVALRLAGLETKLIGAPMTAEAMAARVAPEDLAALSPIDDVRGGAGYRRGAALELVRRALAVAAEARHG